MVWKWERFPLRSQVPGFLFSQTWSGNTARPGARCGPFAIPPPSSRWRSFVCCSCWPRIPRIWPFWVLFRFGRWTRASRSHLLSDCKERINVKIRDIWLREGPYCWACSSWWECWESEPRDWGCSWLATPLILKLFNLLLGNLLNYIIKTVSFSLNFHRIHHLIAWASWKTAKSRGQPAFNLTLSKTARFHEIY